MRPDAEQMAALLRGAPDDAELRAVYADWLLERGGDAAIRGELIHVAARPASAERTARMRDLHRAISADWMIERDAAGFAVSWTPSLAMYRQRADEVFAAEPLLETTVLTAPTEDLERLPQIARVRRLTIYGSARGPGTAGLRALLDANELHLDALALPHCVIGDAGVHMIIGCPALAGLRELHLEDNEIGTSGVCALATSALHDLRVLELSRNEFGEPGLAALAATTTLIKLERIGLRWPMFERDELRDLDQRFPGAIVH